MPTKIDRRAFLRLAGIGSGAAVLGCAGPGSPARDPGSAAAPSRGGPGAPGAEPTVTFETPAFAPLAERSLIVIELAGGNDGLSTAPPLGDPALARLRPTIARPDEENLALDDSLALHPSLANLHRRGVVVVEGVGTATPDLSHFEMLRRWWAGDPTGSASLATGFLGRLCDALDEGAPVTGVSIGGASSPALLAAQAGTLGLPDPGWLWWLGDDGDEWTAAYRDGLLDLGGGPEGDGGAGSGAPAGLVAARRGLAAGLRVGGLVASLPEDEGGSATALGTKLALARRLLAADVGVRVVHVTLDGDFDTHEEHRGRHDGLLAELDAGIEELLVALDADGRTGSVLVATTSEFGRRPEENASAGLDHGTASTMLLAGAVPAGRAGEPVSLTDLDGEGNLRATTSFADYYATIAEGWFGVPAAEVVDGRPLGSIWG